MTKLRTPRGSKAHGLILAAALAALPAAAWARDRDEPSPVTAFSQSDIDAFVSADYSHLSPNGGTSGNGYGAYGGVALKIYDYSLKLTGGYQGITTTGPSLSDWTVGATVINHLPLSDVTPQFNYGLNLGFEHDSKGSYSASTTSFGAMIDYRLSQSWGAPNLVFHAEGGGFTSTGSDGYYGGGGVVGYPCPKLSVGGQINYTRFNGPFSSSGETDYSLSAQYQLPIKYPVDLKLDYTHSQFSSSFRVDTFSLGVRYEFGGPKNLPEFHNDSTLAYNPGLTAIQFKF